MPSGRSNNSANNTIDAAISICSDDKAIETQQMQEADFSFDLWREIFEAIVQNEKRALETWETIAFKLEVTQRAAHGASSDCMIKLELLCEPGKPARLLSLVLNRLHLTARADAETGVTSSAVEAAFETVARLVNELAATARL
jgi:hypothetical protein